VPKSVGPGGNVHVVTLASRPGDPDHPFAFMPMQLTVPVGTTVQWVNDDDIFHTVTSTAKLEPRKPSGLFGHSLLRKGQTFEHTFKRPGTFHYYCQPHADFMFGTVTVRG
jgi:plastocyanin